MIVSWYAVVSIAVDLSRHHHISGEGSGMVVRLVRIRDVWKTRGSVVPSWPSWTFVASNGSLIVGDIFHHDLLVVHARDEEGKLVADEVLQMLDSQTTAAGSFRIRRDGTLNMQSWESSTRALTTPPEIQSELTERLQAAITEHRLPWTPHNTVW